MADIVCPVVKNGSTQLGAGTCHMADATIGAAWLRTITLILGWISVANVAGRRKAKIGGSTLLQLARFLRTPLVCSMLTETSGSSPMIAFTRNRKDSQSMGRLGRTGATATIARPEGG